MKPGRELDLLIAEKVMNLDPKSYYMDFDSLSVQEQNVISRGQGWFPMPLKEYSTNLIDAMDIVDRLTQDQWIAISLICRPKKADAGNAWVEGAKFCVEITHGGQGAYPGPRVYSQTLPHAICIAVLELVGILVPVENK